MKSKLLLITALSAIGLFAIWYARQGGAGSIADPGQGDTAAKAESSALEGGSKDPEVAALEFPEDSERESRESVEAVNKAAAEGGSEAPLTTWDEGETRWLEASVIAPGGTPAAETAYVVALSSQMRRAKTFGDQGPFAALREGREPRRIEGVLAAAAVGADGSVRLALPPETTEAWVAVAGTYLYSLELEHLPEVAATNVMTLRPALGAHVAGVVRAPDGSTGAKGVKVTLDWSLNALLQLGAADAGSLDMSTETDPSGHFQFYGLPVGRPVSVQTSSDEFARSFGEDLQPMAGVRHDLTINILEGGTVKGRVVDERGLPVPAATLTALGREFFGNPTEDLRTADGGDDGRFEIPGLTPGAVWLKVEHDDFQETLGKPFELKDGEVLEVPDIVLDQGLSLSGKITFPDGRPAEGAEIEVNPDLGDNMAGAPMDPRAFAGAGNKAKTNQSGVFEITGLGEGPWAVTVEYEAKGDSPSEEAGRWSAFLPMVRVPSEDLAMTLDPPVNFSGSVVDSGGEPAMLFTVKGERSGSQWYMPPSETRTEAFESEDGQFVFEDLRSGKWHFTVESEGFAPSEKVEVTLPTEDASEFVLFAPIRLAGKVLDPDGLPVPGAEIGKELKGQETIQAMQGRSEWPTTKTDGEGLFELEGVRPGAGSILAKKDGWAPSEGYAYELEEGQSDDEIILVMRRGGTISGEIFGKSGEPAKGCMIILQMPTLEERRFTNADADGLFEETGLKPGSWQVQAFPGITSLQSEDGGAMDQAALIKALKMTSVELKNESTEHVVLGSPPTAPVRVYGTVSLSSEPTAGLIVSFMRGEGGGLEGLKIGTTEKDGSYELVLDEPGDYLMTIQSAGDAGMQNSVEYRRSIPEAEDHELNVSMPMGKITGRVTGPGGAACAGARVTLSMQSGQVFGTIMGGQYNETRADEDGQYEILFVRPGDYAVAAGGSYLGGLLGDSGGLGREVKSVTVGEDGWETVNFQLEAPGELHGVVRDSNGKPVADASIFLRDGEGRLLELFSFQATSASGAFEYDGLAPGEYTITARAEGLASSIDTAVRIQSGEVTETTVAVGAGTMLLVSLTDKSGADIRSRVSVLDEHGHEVNGMLSISALMARVSSGVDGKVQRIGPLPPGAYQVRAIAEDGRSASRRARLGGKPEKKLKLRLK